MYYVFHHTNRWYRICHDIIQQQLRPSCAQGKICRTYFRPFQGLTRACVLASLSNLAETFSHTPLTRRPSPFSFSPLPLTTLDTSAPTQRVRGFTSEKRTPPPEKTTSRRRCCGRWGREMERQLFRHGRRRQKKIRYNQTNSSNGRRGRGAALPRPRGRSVVGRR